MSCVSNSHGKTFHERSATKQKVIARDTFQKKKKTPNIVELGAWPIFWHTTVVMTWYQIKIRSSRFPHLITVVWIWDVRCSFSGFKCKLLSLQFGRINLTHLIVESVWPFKAYLIRAPICSQLYWMRLGAAFISYFSHLFLFAIVLCAIIFVN